MMIQLPPGVDGIYDSEGDIVYLEELLSVINSDPNLPPSPVCEINVPEKINILHVNDPPTRIKDITILILNKMLQRCEDTNLVLNWEKCLYVKKHNPWHEISNVRIEVIRTKFNVLAKLHHPTTIDFAVGASWAQRKTQARPADTLCSKPNGTEASAHYIQRKGITCVSVLLFEDFRPYLVLSKSIVYTDHSALKYLLAKQDAKPRLLWKLSTSSKLATMDPRGDIMVQISPLKRYLMPVSSGHNLQMMPTVRLKMRTTCSAKEKFLQRDEMPLNSTKFVKIFDLVALTSWGLYPSSEGTNHLLVAVDYVSKWVEQKRSITH
ncbi:reverse transcriptase domain-containing protein [Tanacetum coccineum]|uniref:Reverse transcriptase domain-containing protein n=1 Tax=Tanacetum coccineum TaxID=301880 RepID=A0ABQ5B435_9ASTR